MVALLQEPQLELTPEQIDEERRLCALSPVYFVYHYCRIYDSVSKRWIPFRLWPEQVQAIDLIYHNQKTVILKARQLGLTWVVLCYGLWDMLFNPISTFLIFSRRDDEAKYLISDERLKGVYNHLPDWLKANSENRDNVKYWMLSNGSTARAFPTTAGDSYTGTIAVVDEADLVTNLSKLLTAVEPTINAGGKLVLISKSNKAAPESPFKNIFRAARKGKTDYASLFLPWHVHPSRDAQWHEKTRDDYLSENGNLDNFKENYPATPEEAMDAASGDKRLLPEWVNQCKQKIDAIEVLPDIFPGGFEFPSGLEVYQLPVKFREYVAGADCAEGLPNSDDSVTTIIDMKTGEQVARLAGKLSPTVHAAYTKILASFYNDAKVMVERNNHGHGFIAYFTDNNYEGDLVDGYDDRPGWSSSTLGKVWLYNAVAEVVKANEVVIYDDKTSGQLKSIVKGTLRAPQGQMDDHADAFALAVVGRNYAARNQIDWFAQGEFEWQ